MSHMVDVAGKKSCSLSMIAAPALQCEMRLLLKPMRAISSSRVLIHLVFYASLCHANALSSEYSTVDYGITRGLKLVEGVGIKSARDGKGPNDDQEPIRVYLDVVQVR